MKQDICKHCGNDVNIFIHDTDCPTNKELNIADRLEQRLGYNKAVEFLRKANIIMAKFDAEEMRVKRSEYGKQLIELYNEYGVAKDLQIQYQKEITEIFKENIYLWELTTK